MKKRLSLLLIAGLLLGMLSGCGATTEEAENGAIVNKEYSEKTMTTVAGEEVDVANASFALGATAYGYAMVYPESWKDIDKMNLYLVRDKNVCLASYVPQAVVEKLTQLASSEMSEEEMAEASALLDESLIPFAALVAVEEGADNKPSVLEDYRASTLVATAFGYDYSLYYNEDLAREGLGDIDKKNLGILKESLDAMKQNVLIFPPQEGTEGGFKGTLKGLDVEDMKGKAVDASLFAGYDLTMVNVWSTWCGPCVEEMGALEALYQELPENVNLISICADAADEKALTEEILKENKVTFQTLVANEALHDAFLAHLSGFPTTVFVDKDGSIVGDIQLGVPGSDPKSAYMSLIEDRLGMLDDEGGSAQWLKDKEKR